MSDQKYTDDDLRRVAGMKDEIFRDELKTINEALTDIQTKVKKLDGIEEDVNELKDDMQVVKAALTANSSQINDHEQRITRLEASA